MWRGRVGGNRGSSAALGMTGFWRLFIPKKMPSRAQSRDLVGTDTLNKHCHSERSEESLLQLTRVTPLLSRVPTQPAGYFHAT